MSEKKILKKILETEFVAGVETDWDEIHRFINDPEFPTRKRDFRNQLADAIMHGTISPEEFEELTAVDRDDQDDVNSFLKETIWDRLYENEPVSIR